MGFETIVSRHEGDEAAFNSSAGATKTQCHIDRGHLIDMVRTQHKRLGKVRRVPKYPVQAFLHRHFTFFNVGLVIAGLLFYAALMYFK